MSSYVPLILGLIGLLCGLLVFCRFIGNRSKLQIPIKRLSKNHAKNSIFIVHQDVQPQTVPIEQVQVDNDQFLESIMLDTVAYHQTIERNNSFKHARKSKNWGD